jgi:hypothetical protein
MKIFNFLLNLFLAIKISTAQQLAIDFDQFVPVTVPAVDRVYSGILCEKEGDFFDIKQNEKECRDAIVFGHSLCYEGLSSEIVSLINNDFYHFDGFAYYSSARAFNDVTILFQLNVRRSFKEVLLPECRFYLDNL